MADISARAAAPADAAVIAEIYNQGIADRIATFETEPRTTEQIGTWYRSVGPIVVAERAGEGVVAFAVSFPYSARPCYAGINEFSVYVARAWRGKRVGRVTLAALIEAARNAGLHKLTSRVFPENTASRAFLKRCGFAEIGVHRRHGKLDGRWRDCVVVELLIEENCP